MDNFELPQGTENIETKDSSLEGQSLEDATYDSGGYIERSQTIREAETVEGNFVNLIDSAISPAGQTGEDSRAPFEPTRLTKDVDPSTGQSTSEGGTPYSSVEQSPRLADSKDDLSEKISKSDKPALQTAGEGNPDYQDTRADPNFDQLEIGNLGKDLKDTNYAVGGKPSGEDGESVEDHKDFNPDKIDRELPEAKIKAIGQDKQGLIQPEGTQKGPGPGPGTGKDAPGLKKPGGKSGGGPPVAGYGQGWVGEGPGKKQPNKGKTKNTTTVDKTKNTTTVDGNEYDKDGKKTSETHGETKQSCESKAAEITRTAKEEFKEGQTRGIYTVKCGDNSGYLITWNQDGYEVNKYYNPLEGGSPMPYTGSGTGQHTEIPHGPETGPDNEANFLRMVAGGKVEAGKYVGLGSSGSANFSPSGSSEEDDSGKFHGGLYGSAYRPNNPDDPDYYTPNVLKEALKTK